MMRLSPIRPGLPSLRLLFGWGFWLLLAATSAPMANKDPWVLIDTQAYTLSVMQGGKPTLVIPDISIGRYGATLSKRRGDHKTPIGDFRVEVWFSGLV